MNRLPIALLSIALVGFGCQQNKKNGESHRHQAPTPAAADASAQTTNPPNDAQPTQTQARSASESNTKGAPPAPATAQQQQAKRAAVANIKPSEAAKKLPKNSNVTGTATFTSAANDQIRVSVQVSGLEPNTSHGIHIHEKGDLSAPDLMSTGDHFNPDKHKHGAPGTTAHAGDFGNLMADAQGNAKMELLVSNISVGTGKPNDTLGRALIIHANPDDLSSQPSGNAGARIAGGLISPK